MIDGKMKWIVEIYKKVWPFMLQHFWWHHSCRCIEMKSISLSPWVYKVCTEFCLVFIRLAHLSCTRWKPCVESDMYANSRNPFMSMRRYDFRCSKSFQFNPVGHSHVMGVKNLKHKAQKKGIFEQWCMKKTFYAPDLCSFSDNGTDQILSNKYDIFTTKLCKKLQGWPNVTWQDVWLSFSVF